MGQKSKSKNFIECIQKAAGYRKVDTKKLTIRTDNGPQFKSKATEAYMEKMGIEHEFGYKNNPNSQAYIESHHSVIEREFVQLNEFYHSLNSHPNPLWGEYAITDALPINISHVSIYKWVIKFGSLPFSFCSAFLLSADERLNPPCGLIS